MTEQDFVRQLLDLYDLLDWRRYHTYRSKKSPAGFPDEVLVRERVIYAELKADGKKPTVEQRDWLTALTLAGAEVYLWRPDDLDEIVKILQRRGRGPVPEDAAEAQAERLGGLLGGNTAAVRMLQQSGVLAVPTTLTVGNPASAWMRAGCRRDEL